MMYVLFFIGISAVAIVGSARVNACKRQLERVEKCVDAMAAHYEVKTCGHVPPDVQFLFDSGKAVEAVKAYRERTGCGMKEAYDAIRGKPDVVAKLSAVMKHLKIKADIDSSHSASGFMQQGSKIEAIKAIREETGMSLRDAKEKVEVMS